ncbi:MAG: HEPN domain-containing protein [Terriglobia bacterium]|jgi:HEPN domain-containing protein
MNGTVKEWVAKAEADYSTATRELQAAESPNFDAVCFHAHQCVEKLMKALLILLGIVSPRTHDLAELDRLLAPVCTPWSWPVQELRFLTRASVGFRYPGESADREDATESLNLATRMRKRLRALLGMFL